MTYLSQFALFLHHPVYRGSYKQCLNMKLSPSLNLRLLNSRSETPVMESWLCLSFVSRPVMVWNCNTTNILWCKFHAFIMLPLPTCNTRRQPEDVYGLVMSKGLHIALIALWGAVWIKRLFCAPFLLIHIQRKNKEILPVYWQWCNTGKKIIH